MLHQNLTLNRPMESNFKKGTVCFMIIYKLVRKVLNGQQIVLLLLPERNLSFVVFLVT